MCDASCESRVGFNESNRVKTGTSNEGRDIAQSRRDREQGNSNNPDEKRHRCKSSWSNVEIWKGVSNLVYRDGNGTRRTREERRIQARASTSAMSARYPFTLRSKLRTFFG